MKLKLNTKGLSLPLTFGLLLLLVTITTTLNELVIRALRASHQIEAADKAYFAAEGGIEDALYELSAHTAGYQTGSLDGGANARIDAFSESSKWQNNWEIQNRGLNTCADTDPWVSGFNPGYCGRLHEGEKLVINLFTDDAVTTGIQTGAINREPETLRTLIVKDITIKFRIPESIVINNYAGFLSGLLIDNDGDLNAATTISGPEGIIGLNEDGRPDYSGNIYAPVICSAISNTVPLDDNDCDGLEDEDSPEDPVLLWKVVDGSGHTFQPLRGCKDTLPPHQSHTGYNNTILCENSFHLRWNELSAALSQDDAGTDETGAILTLQDFLKKYSAGSSETLQMEILVTAPLKAVDFTKATPILIPYLEYGIEYSATDDFGDPAEIPSTFFSIKSDGYYQDFKQSLTTNVVPRATTRLLDLTIIQQ